RGRVAPADWLARAAGVTGSGTARERVEWPGAERARRPIRVAVHDRAPGCAQSWYRGGRHRGVRRQGLSDGLPVSVRGWGRRGHSTRGAGVAGVHRAYVSLHRMKLVAGVGPRAM